MGCPELAGDPRTHDVRAGVALNLFTDFQDFSTSTPSAIHERSTNAMLDQVVHEPAFAGQ